MIIANYSGTDRKRRCQIQSIGTDLFFVQAKGHQLKAGRVEDGEEQQCEWLALLGHATTGLLPDM